MEDFTEKTKEIFEKLPFINKREAAKLIGMDADNFIKYTKGELKVSEKTYEKLMLSLKEIKELLP